MRLLVVTPTFEDGPEAACVESIRGQQYEGPWEWVIDADDPFPPPDHRNVLAKYMRGKCRALRDGFDAMVTVEHDMVLPPDALAKLVEVAEERAPVVFGTYTLRHGSHVLNTWRYENQRNFGMSLSLYPHELRILRKAKIGRVSGVGWGCTLIRRDVLERAPFVDDGQCMAGDLPFAQWCLANDVLMLARFDLECGHVEDGKILMPYETTDPVRVEPLQRVRVLVDGATVTLEEGQPIDLPAFMVADLERAGYVRRLAVERAVVEDAPGVEHAVSPVQRKRKK